MEGLQNSGEQFELCEEASETTGWYKANLHNGDVLQTWQMRGEECNLSSDY